MNKAKQLGFSLIELIFVIAIIGVMASLGVSYYQHRAENTKVTKAAIEMQQVMQAAQAYYEDNGCWPNTCPASKAAPNFINYIPGQLTPLNPWGEQISWQAIPTGGATPLFRVFTYTPQADSTKLAALLPNAQTGIKCQNTNAAITSDLVCADVTSNGTDSNNQFIIKDLNRYAWLGSKDITVECKNSETPGIMVAPQAVHQNSKEYLATVNWNIEQGDFSCTPSGPGKKSCTINIHADGTPKKVTIAATYMTYCKKNSA